MCEVIKKKWKSVPVAHKAQEMLLKAQKKVLTGPRVEILVSAAVQFGLLTYQLKQLNQSCYIQLNHLQVIVSFDRSLTPKRSSQLFRNYPNFLIFGVESEFMILVCAQLKKQHLTSAAV